MQTQNTKNCAQIRDMDLNRKLIRNFFDLKCFESSLNRKLCRGELQCWLEGLIGSLTVATTARWTITFTGSRSSHWTTATTKTSSKAKGNNFSLKRFLQFLPKPPPPPSRVITLQSSPNKNLLIVVAWE